MGRRHTNQPGGTETLRARLGEAEEMLRAIRHGEIDALVVEGAGGNQVAARRRGAVPQPRGTDAGRGFARQVDHMSQLINDLLDIERVVSGRVRLDRQPLDLADAVRQAVGAVTGDAVSDRCIDISTEPVWVEGDRLRLEQVLTNLVTNAVKYTPTGGRIRVTLRADGDDAVISVEDSGLGISPALLPFIFDLYVQADRTLDRAHGGLGIGLALVRRLVELHGGTVEAASDGEGRGSRFTVRLRQVPSARESSAIAAPRERRAKPRRVLLIEDSGDARQMLRMMLELAGHVVYDAPDGVRGLELLKVVRPDVGIIDIGFPGWTGTRSRRAFARNRRAAACCWSRCPATTRLATRIVHRATASITAWSSPSTRRNSNA